jgi:hypothetical protein
VVTFLVGYLEIGVCVEKSGCDPPENGQHKKSWSAERPAALQKLQTFTDGRTLTCEIAPNPPQ